MSSSRAPLVLMIDAVVFEAWSRLDNGHVEGYPGKCAQETKDTN